MSDRIFTFNFQIYTENAYLNDQNVIAYEFVNLGSTDATLSNQLIITRAGGSLSRYKEDILQGQKTGTQYQLKWVNEKDPNNKLLVITKVELFK